MEIKKYNDCIKETQPQDAVFAKLILAFISGGCIGLLAQVSKVFLMEYFMIEASLASSYVIACIIIITAITTGLGWYEKLAQYCGAGLFIPISGFSNALTSSALEGKSEGLIYGIGSKMFALAGSVLTYGIVSAALFALLRYLLFGGNI